MVYGKGEFLFLCKSVLSPETKILGIYITNLSPLKREMLFSFTFKFKL